MLQASFMYICIRKLQMINMQKVCKCARNGHVYITVLNEATLCDAVDWLDVH